MGRFFSLVFLVMFGLLMWLPADKFDRRQFEDIDKCVELKIGTKPQCEFLVKRLGR